LTLLDHKREIHTPHLEAGEERTGAGYILFYSSVQSPLIAKKLLAAAGQFPISQGNSWNEKGIDRITGKADNHK